MKTYAKKVITNPLFSGSAVMVFGSNMANFFAYLYHFVVGRLLAPAQYGEVGAILSLLGLLSVFVSFLGLVIVKFVSSAGEKELSSVLEWFYKIGFKSGLVISAIIFLATPLIAQFLRIEMLTIVLIGPIFFVSTLGLIYRSFLQGLLRFKALITVMNSEMTLRLIFSVIFILLGFQVFGAVIGYFLANLVSLFVLYSYIKKFRLKNTKHFFDKHKDVFFYSIPIFISSFFSYALISLDVIAVKHYFSPEEAGIYTVLSTLGRIIFFAVSPISAVMFPIIVKRKALKQEYKQIFRLSLFMSISIVVGAILVYATLPNLIVGLLYGSGRYLEAYPLLVWEGIFIGFYTLASQVISYYLSLNITKVIVLVPIALIAQVIGIILFHDSLQNVILVSIVATGALLLSLIGRLVYDREI